MSYHLQQCKIAQANIVKVNFQISPKSSIVAQIYTIILCFNILCSISVICGSVDAHPEFSRK